MTQMVCVIVAMSMGQSKGLCFFTQSFGPIAQLAEHRADNAGVSGSSPLGPTVLSVHSC